MKEWEEANRPKIEEFEKKMAEWEKANAPKMEEYEQKMKAWEKENQPKMEEFQKKMEIWEKENKVKLEEFQKKMFEPFEQESTGNKRMFEGTGLGLAITKNLISLLQGKIEVRSKINVGTEVKLEIPLPKS